MSITKLKSPTGETKWMVRVYEDGRGSKRIKRIFDRKNDAEGFLQDFKAELKTKAKDPFGRVSLSDRTFLEEADYWLMDGRLRFSPSHLKRVEGVLKELLPALGDFKIDKFSPELLTRLQQSEKSKGLANGTINRKTEVISAILNFSTKQRRIPFNPSVGFKKLGKDTQEMSFWNEEEATSFLNKMNELYPKSTDKRWVYVAYLLALNTAMRAGEIWGLQAHDVLSDGSIWVRRQFNRVTQSFAQTKGKKARHVPCNRDLYSELSNLLENQELKAEAVIFQNEKRKPVCHDNFADRQFSKDLKAWGGKPIRFHDLRHTATTLMIASGVDIKTVKEVCGHADIATTMNYVHLLSGSVSKVSDLFSLKATSKEESRGKENSLSLVR